MFFLKGFLFGMMLQLSIGPVCLAVWHRSITSGFKEAFKMAWGVTLADSFFILASFWGVDRLLKITVLKNAILAAGAFVLIYFGIKYIQACSRETVDKQKEVEKSLTGSFSYGVRLTLTNPLTVLFWSGVFGSLIASGRLGGFNDTLFYSLGCVSSTIFFLGLVAAGGSRLAVFMNERRRKYLDCLVGILLIIFGISMAAGGLLG